MKQYKIIKLISRYFLFRLNRNDVVVPVENLIFLSCLYAAVKFFRVWSILLLSLAIFPSNAQQNQESLNPEAGLLVEQPTKTQINRSLRANLDAQFKRIQALRKTENSYSEKLGEEYLNYGFLLKQAGEINEARKMIVDALHISKVNNGVYAIEQRPILRALFEIDSLRGNSEKMEEDFAKIEWLEIKNSDHIGTYSLDIMLQLGHHFLDRYLIQPSQSEVSLALVNSAAQYFSRAINRYSFKINDVSLMPYGELLEVYLYRVKLLERLSGQQGPLGFNERRRGDIARGSIGNEKGAAFIRERDRTKFFIKQYSNQYLERARKEKNQTQVVSALLAIADWNLLLKREKKAAEYYEFAWEEGQKMEVDDPLRLSFNNPVRLPAFSHSYENQEARRVGATYSYVPVTVNIGADGYVDEVEQIVLGATSKKIATRARRIVKATKFRPPIIDGQMRASDQHREEIRVLINKK